jgi:hypothetical protein
MVFEFLRFEPSGLLVHDMLGEIEHVLGDLDVLDLVEITPQAAATAIAQVLDGIGDTCPEYLPDDN